MTPGTAIGLVERLGFLAVLGVLELGGVSVWLDTQSLAHRAGLASIIGDWGPGVLSAIVAAAAAAAAMAYVSAGPRLASFSRDVVRSPVSFPLLGAHLVVLACWVFLSREMFTDPGADRITVPWMVTGTVCVVLAVGAFIPFRHWVDALRATRPVWLYAAITAVASAFLRQLAEALWEPASRLTFALVKASLTPFVRTLVADPVAYKIASPRFSVIIAKECSGLEGMGLMLVFGSLWLWFLRREYRFPRALLLIPVGLIVMWLANIVRLDILFLIGHAGWRAVAAGGFHSQAGWIAFVAVALGLTAASHRVSWLARDRAMPSHAADVIDAVAAYLVPVLAILAAGMIAGALSGDFEWMYPLRVAAAVVALWTCRSGYADLNWRFGWTAPLAGVLAFGIWLLPDLLRGGAADPGAPAGLAALPGSAALLWLAFRIVGGVLTVPVAEELAFRGYLMRRLVSSDFSQVAFERVPLVPILVSSLVFGALHGDRAVPAMLAGAIYAGVIRRSGRMGDAVVAHATTNALIAIAVLVGGQWRLW